MSNHLKTFILMLSILSLTVGPLYGEAEENKDEQVRGPVILCDEILQDLRKGANFEVFGKKIGLSDSGLWVSITQDNLKDPQALFDELLKKLSGSLEPREIIGGGSLAIELDRVLGKKLNNQGKLVEFLAKQLKDNKDTECRIFVFRALMEKHFIDSSVFSETAREYIYQSAIKHPQLIGLFGFDDMIKDAWYHFLLLVAKAGRTDKAVQLIENIRKEEPRLELLCSVALAKMGIEEEQNILLDRFRNTDDLQEKYRLAYALGWWGERKAQEALAEALRTPGLVKFKGLRPPEMIRLHIAIALIRTVPEEERDEWPQRGCFSWTEKDFITIEKWATKHLGTKWRVPRPKYYPVEIVPF